MNAEVTKVYGLRAPGARGWNKTLVWCDLSDGGHYGAMFDDGKDFVPDNTRVPKDTIEKMANGARKDGWTEVMTPEEVAGVCNLKVGDKFPAPKEKECVLF